MKWLRYNSAYRHYQFKIVIRCNMLSPKRANALRSGVAQIFIIIFINVPTLSFGLTFGWVSVESGSLGSDENVTNIVAGAALTLATCALGVPLVARAIRLGRKPALVGTSAGFLISWLLCVCGGWWVVAGRALAGLCGAAAWAIAPLLAREMCSAELRGAGGGAPVVAHNLGMLLMYLVADQRLDTQTILWCCVYLSAAHCVFSFLIPESPTFLAANGKMKAATKALYVLRGGKADLAAELDALPSPEKPEPHLKILWDMWKDSRQRKALVMVWCVVVGQELCGVFTLLQFAERVFILAGEGSGETSLVADESTDASAARRALLLGAVQFFGSLIALGFVEKFGRRPLLLWSSIATCVSLAGAFTCLLFHASSTISWATLAIAVLSDSTGVQTAPYAIMADVFKQPTVILLATSMTSVAGAVETTVLPLVAGNFGLLYAFGVAIVLSGLYAGFVCVAVPETKGRSVGEILDVLSPVCCRNAECTKV